jgi:hypothetical protein
MEFALHDFAGGAYQRSPLHRGICAVARQFNLDVDLPSGMQHDQAVHAAEARSGAGHRPG